MNDVSGYAAAGVSAASTVGAWTWLVHANQIAALLASLVAIAAGAYAIRHYRRLHRK
jgi:hypothetical protein